MEVVQQRRIIGAPRQGLPLGGTGRSAAARERASSPAGCARLRTAQSAAWELSNGTAEGLSFIEGPEELLKALSPTHPHVKISSFTYLTRYLGT